MSDSLPAMLDSQAHCHPTTPIELAYCKWSPMTAGRKLISSGSNPVLAESRQLSAMQMDRLSLNSIHCNPLRPWQFVVGGSDIFARVYDQRRSLSPSAGASATPASSAAAMAEPVSPSHSLLCHSSYASLEMSLG